MAQIKGDQSFIFLSPLATVLNSSKMRSHGASQKGRVFTTVLNPLAKDANVVPTGLYGCNSGNVIAVSQTQTALRQKKMYEISPKTYFLSF